MAEYNFSAKSSRYSSKSGTELHKTLFNLEASNDQLLMPIKTTLFLFNIFSDFKFSSLELIRLYSSNLLCKTFKGLNIPLSANPNSSNIIKDI